MVMVKKIARAASAIMVAITAITQNGVVVAVSVVVSVVAISMELKELKR